VSVRIQFLVAAHKEPAFVSRLCERLLEAPDVAVQVQWDSARPTPDLVEHPALEVRPTAAPCEWGSGLQLDAMLDSLDSLATRSFDWLVVLSGQDYPVRPITELVSLLEATEHELFFQIEDGPEPLPDVTPVSSYLHDRYSFHYRWIPQRWWSRMSPSVRRVIGGGMQRAVRVLARGGTVRVQRRPNNVFSPGFGRRARTDPFTDARPCRKGSDWFALSRAAFDDLICQVHDSPDLVHHYRRTYCPNESIFHTLLLPRWGSTNAGHNLHYVRFVGERAHPETMSEEEWDLAVASGAFFARKFDPDDIGLLDQVDRSLLSRSDHWARDRER
jgi:hypothetical protein